VGLEDKLAPRTLKGRSFKGGLTAGAGRHGQRTSRQRACILAR